MTLFAEGDVSRFVGPGAVAQSQGRHDGKDDQQQVFQHHIRRMVLQPGAAHGPQQGEDDGGQGQLPFDVAVFDEPAGGDEQADARRELVGTQGEVGGRWSP